MFLPCLRIYPLHKRQHAVFIFLLYSLTGVGGSQVLVPQKVSAVLGKNVTLGCSVEVEANLSLTQSSWERRLPTGSVTVAVYNPVFGISIPPDYVRRLSFRSPSSHDATIVLEDVGFADIGVYTCKVATFPLGNTQASTTVSVLVEPKVYVSAGSVALIDEGNETVVATCIAERALPPAEVSWETDLFGHSEVTLQDEANGTTSTQVHYLWQPTRHVQGHALTCVVRHPALHTDFRIPYQLNVEYAPDIVVVGYDGDWHLGRESVQLTCKAKANPPAHHFRWIRLDGDMPEGVEILNNTLLFLRPLQRNDSGVYRCEVANAINLRSRDLRIRIQDPPTTSMPSTTPAPVLTGSASSSSSTSVGDKQRVLFTSPTLAALPPTNQLGAIVGGAVGGALFLLLLLVLGGVCYLRQRQTFRGDYYTKQYLGPSDMQKAPPQHELHPSKPDNNVFVDKDREEWGDRERNHERDRERHHLHPTSTTIMNSHNHREPERQPNGRTRAMRNGEHHDHDHLRSYPSPHQTSHARYAAPPHPLSNGSPYLSDDCYDSGAEGDYVSHMDGSVISRREWYV
ncbi:nectin-3-like protein isoform X1 [Salmo trutta]|uniref:Nectin cell adhesion molecule 3 n=1 Tax=Salmo trutta TaxID=8032 RepID=A0A673ZFS6_SALTR|nr:nectin-3-like protein isoform X1 [Salmo trutta]